VKVADIQHRLGVLKQNQDADFRNLKAELEDLKRLARKAGDDADVGKVVAGTANTDVFARRIEWVLPDFSQHERKEKTYSIWSPKFRVAGLDGLQLEFFPKGRENTQYDGFCSLFLWCPDGTKIRYQLWVGKFLRAPDEDIYQGRIGHGHSNLCPLAPEVDRANDSLTLGVTFLNIQQEFQNERKTLSLQTTPFESLVSSQADYIMNKDVNKVVWKIKHISQKKLKHPKGSSMWSKLFTAAGIRDMLLEFYPQGSVNTTKDGFCAFYIRCPQGVSMIVTLFVGNSRKGPIKTSFDSQTGKGLPDFCNLDDEINREEDFLEIGIEVQNQASKTLSLCTE
jgi:hypothetical protein